jgi:uncharacterized cupredoxin-like copper-binding protein
LLNPRWMAWSKIGLPESVRWLGLGVGVICALLTYWLFSSIGSGITPTSATRKQHVLVTHGPYRWVRHPLYTVGSTIFISFGMLADNWFIASLGVLAFIAMAIRTPKEEANLIEKFGDEYREYMKRTGRFLPKFNSETEQIMKNILKLLQVASLLLLTACAAGGPSPEINVEMTDFAFSPNHFAVPAGAEITVNAAHHGVVIHEFIIMKSGTDAGEKFDEEDLPNVYLTVDVPAGHSQSFTFTAPDQAGDYQIVCGIAGHLQAGMVGRLIVEANP